MSSEILLQKLEKDFLLLDSNFFRDLLILCKLLLWGLFLLHLSESITHGNYTYLILVIVVELIFVGQSSFH